MLVGIGQLDLTADVSGTIRAPRLAVTSNLDRQIADRLRAVAGQQLAAAEAKVRAQVDRMVDERTAPLRAKIDDVRGTSERRMADARAKLDEQKRKLADQLKVLSGGLGGLPRLPGA